MQTKGKQFKPKGTQVGNFIVSFEKGNFESVKITSVAGNWNIRFREDNALYNFIKRETKTKEGINLLEYLFSTWYMATNGVPDLQFIQDIIKAYNNSIERIMKISNQLSDEEHDKILEEEKENYNNTKNGTGN